MDASRNPAEGAPTGGPGLRGLGYGAALAALAVVYALSAKVGLAFAFAGANVSPLWPPTGIAIAAVMIGGLRMAPGVLLGAFLANAFISPLPWSVAAGIAAGNTAEALAAGWMMRQWKGFDPSLCRLRDVVALGVLAVGLAPMLSATNGALVITSSGLVPREHLRFAWWTWWTGDAMGALVLAPLILVWSRRPWTEWAPSDGAKGVGILLSIGLLGGMVFLMPNGGEARFSPLAFLVLPGVILAAHSFGPPGATVANLLAGSLAIWGTARGAGAYAGFEDLNEKVALLQGFIAVTSAFSLGFAALVGERRRAEDRLAKSEHRYRAVTQTAYEAILISDSQGRIISWNPAAKAMFGLDEAATLGRPVAIIIPPRYRALHERGLDRYRDTGETPILGRALELEGLRSDGTVFPIEFTVSSWVQGEDRYFAALIRDITERKAMEAEIRRFSADLEARVEQRTEEVMEAHRELEKRAVELVRSNQELEQFAYVASHDLQEPLRMVTAFTQLMAERNRGRLDPETDEFIDFAVKGAQHMQQLIHDLLSYARVSSEASPMEPTPLEEVLDQALRNLGAALEESGGSVHRDPLPVVVVDRVQWVQLFQNLLGNAIKFRGARPLEIHVGAREEQGGWLFWVRDNGIGMDPRFQERIFVLFQRLHPKGEYPGTGLGLSICKKIVERHGGRIWAVAAAGEGSTFFFTLSA